MFNQYEVYGKREQPIHTMGGDDGEVREIATKTRGNSRAESRERQTPKEIFTRRQVRDMLNVSYPTLNEWHKKGILRHFKRGRRVVLSL